MISIASRPTMQPTCRRSRAGGANCSARRRWRLNTASSRWRSKRGAWSQCSDLSRRRDGRVALNLHVLALRPRRTHDAVVATRLLGIGGFTSDCLFDIAVGPSCSNEFDNRRAGPAPLDQARLRLGGRVALGRTTCTVRYIPVDTAMNRICEGPGSIPITGTHLPPPKTSERARRLQLLLPAIPSSWCAPKAT